MFIIRHLLNPINRRRNNLCTSNVCALIKYYCTNESPPNFPGAKTQWCNRLKFIGPHSYSTIPIYRVLDKDGHVIDVKEEPILSNEFLIKMYKDMLSLNVMDKILYDAQRQGRISFYMTSYGEEATVIGSAAGLESQDVVYGQYRESGVLLWRGFTAEEFVDQCYGNVGDVAKGRQMPVHFGSRRLNFVTISSPLATQMPQAVGAAYALRDWNCAVICYFGEGAASEGDAYAAFNFAATLECPVVLFCRNNGFAISTPVEDQYEGDGVAARGPAMGINTLRVDGNDVLAVYKATKMARDFAVSSNQPVLLEALCYRIGHHSTSDDSTAYRSKSDVNHRLTHQNPITRFKMYLREKNLWTEDLETKWLKETKADFLKAFQAGEKKLKPKWTELFSDVYEEMPPHIRSQMEEMKKHVRQYQKHYPLNKYEKITD